MHGPIFYRHQRFYPAVEIARHPVRGGNEDLGPPGGKLVPAGEADDPAVFQETADNAAHADVFG